MNKLILVFLLSFYSKAFANESCPAKELPSSGMVDFGDQLACHLDINPTEKYSSFACDEYKRCAGTLKFTPEDMVKKRKDSMLAIAKAHGKKSFAVSPKIIENFKFYDAIKIYLESQYAGDVASLGLCDNMLSYVETDKCSLEVMDEIIPEEIRNYDKNQAGQKGALFELLMPILHINPKVIDTEEKFLNSNEYKKIMEIVNTNTVLQYMEKNAVKEFLLNIYRIKSEGKEEADIRSQHDKRKDLVKKETFLFGGKIAKEYCAKVKVDNLQKQCEDFTRISRGMKPIDADDRFSSQDLSALYSDEKPAVDLFTNLYRCEVFDIKPENNLPSGVAQNNSRSCKSSNKRSPLGFFLCIASKTDEQPTISDLGKTYSGEVASTTYDSIKNKSLADLGASIRESVVADTKSSFPEVAKQLVDQQAAQNSAINPAPVNNFVPQQAPIANQPQTFAAPPIPPIPPSAAAVGVGDVFADSSKSENMNSSELDKLTAKLNDAEKKLQDLQDKNKEQVDTNLKAQIAAKEKDIQDIKSAQQAVLSDNATRSASVIAAKEAGIGNIADAQVQKQIAPEELSRGSGVVRAPAAVQAAAIAKAAGNAAADLASSAATINIEMVDLPKGIEVPRGGDPQSEAKFLEFVRAQFKSNVASTSFKINDPFKGEVEVIKTIAEDGKVNYVLRPLVKKNKKVVAAKKVEPKVNRAPAADDKVRVHKKDMDAILNETAKKGE